MTDNDYSTEVAAGFGLLTLKMPDWLARTEPETLNMYDGRYCVLGQVYGTYANGCADLNLSADDERRYGFLIPHSDDGLVVPVFAYWRLTATWRAAIAAAKQAGAADAA